MKHWGIVILLAGLLAGCLENDVPLPVIYGNVQKIEFEGQQKAVINTKTRTIELTLNDSVNIKDVRLKTLELSADAARPQEVFVTPKATIQVDSVFDLSKKLVFGVNTYQSYDWTVVTEQPIERYFTVENQVGEAMINVAERRVMVIVEEGQDLSDIQVLGVKLDVVPATYFPEPETLTDFTKMQIIKVESFGDTVEWRIRVNHPIEEESAVSVNAWAQFADFQGKVSSGQSGTPAFEYKRGNASKWTRVEATVNGTTFSARVPGLRPRTAYVVRPVFGEEPGEEVPFTTEAAEQIPYSNFDTWYMDGTGETKNAPCVGVEGVRTWDSGNKGGAGFGVIPTTEEKTDKISGSAARLHSRYMVKFASGSLFTGKFVRLKGMDALLDFGIPYTCRPTQLKGYYKYRTAPVNNFGRQDKFKFLEGTNDSCHIYVALCDWTEAFHSDSGEEIFVDYSENNPSIIAYGELKNDRTMDNYEAFTIDIQYRDVTRTPKYIVIVASSSKYGDYFAGGEGSTLWIDEFELGFD